jgi:hypothetical protein
MRDSRLLEDQYMSLCALRSRSDNEDRLEITALWYGLRKLLIAFGKSKLYWTTLSQVVLGMVC